MIGINANDSPRLQKFSNFNPQDDLMKIMELIKKLPLYYAENAKLINTELACIIDENSKEWKLRLEFIESVLKDLSTSCPKDKPLVMVSLGSAYLLIEYLIAFGLIKSGYSNLTFLLVDPSYAFIEEGKPLSQCLTDFRKEINALFEKGFPKENIRFLSCAENVSKYFPDAANVVVLESFPPNGQALYQIALQKMEGVGPKNFLFGGHPLLSSDKSNAILFIPDPLYDPSLILPSAIAFITATNIKEKKSYYVDWGCKIRSDWSYQLIFNGRQQYLDDQMNEFFLRNSQSRFDKKLNHAPNKDLDNSVWVNDIEKTLQIYLDMKIDKMKKVSKEEKLSQKNRALLLETIKQVVESTFPYLHPVFMRQYELDKDEMVNFLSQKGGTYRKIFSHLPDGESASIKIEVIK